MELARSFIRVILAASVCLVLLAAEPAISGDDDKESAYMIYIDPETGKYTVNKVFWKTEFMSRAYPSPLASLTTCGS